MPGMKTIKRWSTLVRKSFESDQTQVLEISTFFPVFKTKNGYGSLSTLEVPSSNLFVRTALKSSEEEEEVVEEPKRRRSTRVRRPVIEPPKGYFSSVFFNLLDEIYTLKCRFNQHF